MNKRQIGSKYEKAAAEYLGRQGYQILERNYRNRTGEIDIIAKDADALVFVEVKYRKSDAYGSPACAVNDRKQQNIRRVAEYYMLTHGCGPDTVCRFDVVTILGEEIALIKNAFGV